MYAISSEIDDSIFTLEYADSVPSLSKAARVGDLDKIRKLLAKGSLPQTPDNRGWTAIHVCAAAGQVEALKLILKFKRKSKKYLVNLTTWENLTPLLIALKAPSTSLKMVQILLKAGASPKLCTHSNLSALHLACLKKGNLELVKLLIEYGADINIQESISLFTPLHFSVFKARDLDMIKYLMNKSNLELKDIHDRTAFLEACNLNFVEAVQLFIKKDKNLANEGASMPPMVYAGVLGSLEMAQILIDSGADLNCRCKAVVSCDSDLILLDREYFLPIHSSLCNLEVFKLLLRTTDPNEIVKVNTNFCTFPLFVLVYGNDVSFFETLLQSDLPVELKVISCRVLINFILGSPQMADLAAKKFSLFFKYNFYLEPEDVFQNFVCLMSKEELRGNLKFLYELARMGISSGDEISNKNSTIACLESFLNKPRESEEINLIRSTCDLLSLSVLSLKQYCRIVIRRHIKSLMKSDWLALKFIKESNLPYCLKRFLLFEPYT